MLNLLNLLPLLALSLTITSEAKPVSLSKRFTGVHLVSGRDGKCLSVAPGTVDRGLAVTTVDCNTANTARTWDLNPGSGSVFFSGSGLALDAGSNPGNNGNVKLWTSYPGLYQQTWYFTDDNRIAITGGDQCLDAGPNGPQTYKCTPGNTNQIWYAIQPDGTTPPPTQPPVVGVLPNLPKGPIYTDDPSVGQRIHPYGRDDLCIVVQGGGTAGVGSLLEINYCVANDNPQVKNQLFNLLGARFSTPVKLSSNPSLCIDLGSAPANGGVVKLWTCIDGLSQQQLYFPRGLDGKLAAPPNQCIDVAEGGGGRLQTWNCFPNNNNQVFKNGIL